MKGLFFFASSGCHSGTRVERQKNTVPANANKNTMVFIWRPKVFIWRPQVFLGFSTKLGVYLVLAARVFIWRTRARCLFGVRPQVFIWPCFICYIYYICYICYYMYCIWYIQYICHICHLGYMGHIYICYRMTPAGRPKHTQPPI